MRSYSPHTPLLSLHIPKCGGQSFRRVLEQFFRGRLFLHYFQQNDALPPKHQEQPGCCIHGHFNRTRGFGTADYYPSVHQFIAVLRDPVEAAISNYFFWKAKARALQLGRGTLAPGADHDYGSLDDFFRKRPRSSMLDFMPPGMTEASYQDIIETRFVWIGLTEGLQGHVDRLAGVLGIPTVRVERLNTTTRDEELSPAVREDFIRNNRLECAIYRHVRTRLAAGAAR